MDVTDFFGKYAESYAHSDSHARGSDLELLVGMLNIGKKDRALDIATGTGFTAFALAEKALSVVALDKTPEMLEQAEKIAEERGISNVEFVIGDVADLPYSDATFEIVTSRRAPHHFPDKKKFMSEVVRVLVSGGRFGISDLISPEDDVQGLYNTLERNRDPTHLVAETFSGWKNILEEAGLTISEAVVMQERVKFEEWLSPILTKSEEGKACIEFLRNAPDYFQKQIEWNEHDMSFVKRRGVIAAQK